MFVSVPSNLEINPLPVIRYTRNLAYSCKPDDNVRNWLWHLGTSSRILSAGRKISKVHHFINLLLTYLTVLIYLTTQVWSTKGTARKISSVKNIFFDISFNKKFSFRFLTCMFVILLRLYPALKILQLIWWWWCYLLPQKPYSYLSSASAKTGQL